MLCHCEVVTTYADRWIECTDAEIRVRGYYFPWGTKRIPYANVKGVRAVTLTRLRGRGRIWGTANLGYWASLDPRRMRKKRALILDLGRRVKPFLTPDDTDAALRAIADHVHIDPVADGGTGPLI